jgi:hypothetical protein
MTTRTAPTRMLALAITITLFGLTVGCGPTPSPPNPPTTPPPSPPPSPPPGAPATLVSIVVTPSMRTTSTGANLQFVATGSYSDATTKDLSAVAPATWRSSAPATATISNTGLAAAIASGTTTISATSGTITGSTSLTVTQATASPPSVQTLRAACASIKGQTVGGVMVTGATRVETSAIVPAGLCVVLGTRAPFLDMEVVIPDNWSGRMLHQGGAGFDGTIPSAITKNFFDGSISAVNVAVTQKGAIYTASNGGNRASDPAQAAPSVWAGGTADGLTSGDDYAYRALGTTIGFAKSLATIFYSAAPKWTYFNGCSEGGREAYIVAERWPGEYSGIVQGCETMDMTALASGLLNVASKGGAAALSADQYTDAYTRAVALCDRDDGLVDGYLTNPARCNLDPAVLQCGNPLANFLPWLCLSAAQVATLQSLLSDLKLSTGALAYSKYAWSNFGGFLGAAGFGGGGLGGGFALLATNDPLWIVPIFGKQATFDLNRDYPIIHDGLVRRGAEHDKAAIAGFVASGKKLLAWNDSGDPLVSASDHARNHAAMTDIAKTLGLGDPRANTRLFMVPASDHGAGGDFSSVDWLSAIVEWVESNKPPVQLTYSFTAGFTARTLPVCEYPAYPRYNGSGNVNSASSFTCTAP